MKNLPASQRNSSKDGAKREKIATLINLLALNYPRAPMSDGQLAMWLELYCRDLEHYEVRQIERACAIYRQNPDNKFMATSGALIGIMRGTSEPKTINGRVIDGEYQPWGGACQCERCRAKTPRKGFYKAPPEFRTAADAERREVDDWFSSKLRGAQ